MANRQRDLTSTLDGLRAGALTRLALIWSRVDSTVIWESWAPVFPDLVELHRVLVMQSLDAVDDFMLLTAADAGWRYDVTWLQDAADRPQHTGRGRPDDIEIAKTPGYVLWRIKQGKSPEDAMLMGYNYLARIFGTEAHQIGRELPLARVRADMAKRGV
jgi:hypothetical protein